MSLLWFWLAVVSAYEYVAVLVFQLPINVLLGLFQCDVHVAVKIREHACIGKNRNELRKLKLCKQKWPTWTTAREKEATENN